MQYVIIGVVVVVIIGGFIYNMIRRNKIMTNGVEADAVVSRIETDTNTDSDGDTTTTETYYVTYQNAEGNTVEARLGNPPAHCFAGTRLRVKYLPEKPKYVISIK